MPVFPHSKGYPYPFIRLFPSLLIPLIDYPEKSENSRGDRGKETMKVLLVNPQVPETFWSLCHALKFISKKALLPPLGLLTIAAMLPKTWTLKLVDMNVDPLDDADIDWADLVFLTGMFIQRRSAEEVIDRCRSRQTRLVAGGPLFNAIPELYPTIDYLVLKEAEETLPAFLRDLEGGSPRPFYTTRHKPDLAASPIPRWDLIDLERYALMGIQYSRGCPYNCDFCDVTKLFGHAVRTKTTGQILAELQALYDLGWRREVFFVDDNFIGRRKRLKEDLLPALIRWREARNYPFSFNTQASIDLADDDELLDLMARAGFDCVFVGIETPSEESLSECGKRQNQGRDLVACVHKIHRAGMEVQAGFILGFDSDKPDVFDTLIRFIQDSGIVMAMVGLLNAPRGTRLYKRLQHENRLSSIPTGDNTDYSINFEPKMDPQKLLSGYERVVTTIYSPDYYYRRILNFLKHYRPNKKVKPYFRSRDIRAFVKSMWHIGIKGQGAGCYWKLLLQTLWRPACFRLAVAFSIYGFHFRKTFRHLKQQHQTRHPLPPPPAFHPLAAEQPVPPEGPSAAHGSDQEDKATSNV